MEQTHLNFKYNACKIEITVAGGKAAGSGFLYITAPKNNYNYVITAKHLFQEEDYIEPEVDKICDLKIGYYKDKDTLDYINLTEIKANVVFYNDIDLAIIRIKKMWLPYAMRIMVKNFKESTDDNFAKIYAFPDISPNQRININLKVDDSDLYTCKVESGRLKEIQNYHGISGAGVFSEEEPYLFSVISNYSFYNFENDQLAVANIDWNKVNVELDKKGWEKLKLVPGKYNIISDDNTIINIEDVEIDGVHLDLEKARLKLNFDLRDDWFFDPLHNVDMCSRDYILSYFSISSHRTDYTPSPMEVCYIPKKTLVLRKAMVGNFIDRLIYMAVVDLLGPHIEKHINRNVYSAHYDNTKEASGLIPNGVEQWTKMNYKIDHWLNDKKGILVKVDLLNYFDTINKGTLIELLREIAEDQQDVAAIILLSKLVKGIAEKNHTVGIPQNSDASSLLATFYVSHIDTEMIANTIHYCRFMDDIFFVAKDIYQTRQLLQKLEKELRKLDLSVNSSKIQFINIGLKSEREEFRKQLYTFDYERQSAYKLVTCHQKARRMNGISILVDDINRILSKRKLENDDERALSFCLNLLSNYKIHLYAYWDKFYEDLLALVKLQINDPSRTPFLCRIISSIDKTRNIEDVKAEVAKHLIQGHCTYEWQTYNLWLLLADLKYETPELVKYAANEIDRNDETRNVEISAIMIYLSTIKPEYARILLHRLRSHQVHGYLQKRAVMIATRYLNQEAFENKDVKDQLPDCLFLCHKFLYENKDKPLVFFHNISSHRLSNSESTLFPELYSGL